MWSKGWTKRLVALQQWGQWPQGGWKRPCWFQWRRDTNWGRNGAGWRKQEQAWLCCEVVVDVRWRKGGPWIVEGRWWWWCGHHCGASWWRRGVGKIVEIDGLGMIERCWWCVWRWWSWVRGQWGVAMKIFSCVLAWGRFSLLSSWDLSRSVVLLLGQKALRSPLIFHDGHWCSAVIQF